jgi:hypothetical protein
MSRRAQRWLFWIFIAFVALQIYVVREWLAVLFLVGVVFAGVTVLVAFGLVLNSVFVAIAIPLNTAWQWLKLNTAALRQVSRPALAFARALLVDSKSQ